MRQRPENFVLDYSHSLARGLVFAGLAGGCVGSKRYIDSSSYRNHGVLTNMVTADDWVWVDELGRWGLDFIAGTTEQNVVVGGSATAICQLLTSMTFSCWCIFINDSETKSIVSTLGGGSEGWSFRIAYNEVIQLATGGSSYDGTDLTSTIDYSGIPVHLAFTSDASRNVVMYLNGAVDTQHASVDAPGTSGVQFVVGGVYGQASRNFSGTILDPLLHNRALSPAEIAVLANRSDPMLGGLLLPPKRKLYVIKYHPTTARLLTLKQNNRFLSLQKI